MPSTSILKGKIALNFSYRLTNSGRVQLRRPFISNRAKYFSSIKSDDPRILASIDGGLKSGPAEPLPQDAKGQAKSAFRQIGFAIRAIFYGTMGLGLTAAVGFVGVHLWVEYLELPPGQRDATINDLSYGWDHETQGWGAGHAGKGTDPRIGWRARALIRSAWVAENWQAGQVALGSQESHNLPQGRLVDSAYAMSESRLQQAIFMAKEAGLKLGDCLPTDRTLFELQLRLANICERINTPLTLIKSWEIYSQLWKSCIKSIDRTGLDDSLRNWTMHQAMRMAENLGKVGLKIAALEHSADDPQLQTNVHQEAAENYLIWAINRGLSIDSNTNEPALVVAGISKQQSAGRSKSAGSSTWWNWFGKLDHQPKNSASVNGINGPFQAHLEPIEKRLKQLSNLPVSASPSDFELFASPVRLRLTISSLLTMSAHLASLDLFKALTMQNVVHQFIDSATRIEEAKDNKSPDAQLQSLWLKSRAALSLIYLSELGQITGKMKDQSIVDQSRNGLELADSILRTLQAESSRSIAFQAGLTRASSGRLSEQVESLKRDARLTAAMASSFLGLKYEQCPPKTLIQQSDSLQSRFGWCYASEHTVEDGCQLAKKFLQLAVDYSLGEPNHKDESQKNKSLALLEPLNQNTYHLSRIEQKALAENK